MATSKFCYLFLLMIFVSQLPSHESLSYCTRKLFCAHSCWCCGHIGEQAESPRAPIVVQGPHDNKCYASRGECRDNCKDHDTELEP
ncbi:hypothetical protein ACET3Z_013613 [Daucus carota]